MPSARQLRTLVVGVLIGVVFVLFYTSRLRQNEVAHGSSLQDFYQRTVHGLDKKPPEKIDIVRDKDGDGNIDADDERLAKEMRERLKTAEEKAKEAANRKAPRPDAPSDIVGMGNSAAHQDPDESKGDEAEEIKADDPASVERQAVEAELNVILKKSPVIIFSKTYCGFSKRAKGILLEKYTIDPAPFVVELDEHKLGAPLQNYLAEKTGRSTVPNILVSGVSIGGADDLTDLDDDDELINKIVGLSTSKVTMKESFPKAS